MMGAFGETMAKMQKLDREVRFNERFALMKRLNITLEDIEAGKWEIREEGPFGKTVLKAYKLIESVEVSIESLVRASTTTLVKEEE